MLILHINYNFQLIMLKCALIIDCIYILCIIIYILLNTDKLQIILILDKLVFGKMKQSYHLPVV